jgi:hypothetical protein
MPKALVAREASPYASQCSSSVQADKRHLLLLSFGRRLEQNTSTLTQYGSPQIAFEGNLLLKEISFRTAHVAAAACVAAAAPLGPRTDRAEGGRPGPCTISNKKISLDGSVSSASHPTRLATTLPMVQSVSVAGHFLLKTGLSALQPP